MTSTAHQATIAWRNRGSLLGFRGHDVFHLRERAAESVGSILCVHGYPTSSWDWLKVWPVLAERHDVVAADMLGYGFSAKPRGHHYSIGEQADLQEVVLAHHGIERFHLLCHDYGDTVGQELLARHRDGRLPGLQSIAFLNGGLFPETHRPRPIQRVLASPVGSLVARFTNERTFARAMRRIFASTSQPSADELETFYALSSRDDGNLALAGLISYTAERRRHRERWVSALIETKLPLLVINGVLDPVIQCASARSARW